MKNILMHEEDWCRKCYLAGDLAHTKLIWWEFKMNWIWEYRICRVCKLEQQSIVAFAFGENYEKLQIWNKNRHALFCAGIIILYMIRLLTITANIEFGIKMLSYEIPIMSTTTVWNLRLTLLEFVVRYGTHIKLNRRTRTAQAQRHAHQYLLRVEIVVPTKPLECEVNEN